MSGRFVSFLTRSSLRNAAFFGKIQCSQNLLAAPRALSTSPAASEGLPDSIKRVGESMAFPDERPGKIYAFNWCLNGDGVTPLKASAFRITKPLDLKLASLAEPKKSPLSVKAADAKKMPEAGTPEMSFETFDEVNQRTRNMLSLSDHLYCPEGHVPGTRTAVRVITNSAKLAPDLLAYLERAPRKEPPESLPITVYAFEGTEDSFAGYAIEEVEVEIPSTEAEPAWVLDDEPEPEMEAKSFASVVVVGQKLDIKLIVAGMELSKTALAEDEEKREAKKESSD
mmetsp:Transcript_16215/g.21213  ORF Transcript_16215/g.21213 Transcript_16215/m.21213 type:complete len:283 (-) Transcript_16215:55-903(-)|eukprot:CAMPEP_0198148938 /NCGR_PEP_ID=MMETSP1443-20131203/44284_1 /TAXON_ID=186043 /ORGANISM="Entomoneis sp., Strain CCMP2396" /LENGTH=282 /DNA_ID=CAMNT_0043813807 /DNA_START=27 /DNA_END=875 /DNA_ORIENTATION=+